MQATRIYGRMTGSRVLIVEDDPLTALDVEWALTDAGYTVCGVAASEREALAMAERFRPEFAVVDINLSPGDGRTVAKTICESYSTIVLFATGQCHEVEGLTGTGALGCLPKPFTSELVPHALDAVRRLHEGEDFTAFPDHMFALRAA